jgi:hypothetical protein
VWNGSDGGDCLDRVGGDSHWNRCNSNGGEERRCAGLGNMVMVIIIVMFMIPWHSQCQAFFGEL